MEVDQADWQTFLLDVWPSSCFLVTTDPNLEEVIDLIPEPPLEEIELEPELMPEKLFEPDGK